MRSTTLSLNPLRRPRRRLAEVVATTNDRAASSTRPGPTGPDAERPWSPQRVLAESERVVGRLQQLEARPWWRVSRRELDELDARLDVLRAHAAEAGRG